MSLLTNAVKASLGTSEVAVYTTPVGKNGILLGGNIANLTGEVIRVDVVVRCAGVRITLIKGVPIPPNDAFGFSGMEQKVVLDQGDIILLKSSLPDSADVFLSLSELDDNPATASEMEV